MTQKKSKKKYLALLLILVGIAGLVFSSIQIFTIRKNYQAAQNEYEALQQTYVTSRPEIHPEGEAGPLEVDILSLQQQNPDCVGWIEVPGTSISYPVLQGSNNETYLKRTFNGSSLSSGAIFMDYRNKPDYSSFNTFIFGHNMLDGTMFADLKLYFDDEFLSANNTVYLHTVNGILTYQIFRAKKADMYDAVYDVIDPDSSARQQFINDFGETGANFTEDDLFLSLSTCTGGNERESRTIVFAVLVQ